MRCGFAPINHRLLGMVGQDPIVSIITTVVFRVPIAYGIAYLTRSDEWPNGHPYALFISLLSAWLIGALLTYLRFRQGKWKNIKLVEQR